MRRETRWHAHCYTLGKRAYVRRHPQHPRPPSARQPRERLLRVAQPRDLGWLRLGSLVGVSAPRLSRILKGLLSRCDLPEATKSSKGQRTATARDTAAEMDRDLVQLHRFMVDSAPGKGFKAIAPGDSRQQAMAAIVGVVASCSVWSSAMEQQTLPGLSTAGHAQAIDIACTLLENLPAGTVTPQLQAWNVVLPCFDALRAGLVASVGQNGTATIVGTASPLARFGLACLVHLASEPGQAYLERVLAYIAAAGIFEYIRAFFDQICGPLKNGPVTELLRCLAMLLCAAVQYWPPGASSVQDITKGTELFGMVEMLYVVMMHPQSHVETRLDTSALRIAAPVIEMLNSLATHDRGEVQKQLGVGPRALQLCLICAQLLGRREPEEHQLNEVAAVPAHLLNEVIVLIGNFTVENHQNQE